MRKQIELTWQGKEYKPLITMEVIDRIEDTLNLSLMVSQQTNGDFRLSRVARLLSILINEAGGETTQKSVWDGMFGNGDISTADLVPLMATIWAAIYPESKKKDMTTTKSPTRKKQAVRTKASTK
jgi:hypothetical protein